MGEGGGLGRGRVLALIANMTLVYTERLAPRRQLE